MNKYIFIIAFLILIPQTTGAINFNYQLSQSSEAYQIKIFFEDNQDNFNTIEGEIKFSTPNINQAKILNTNSIIDFWIDQPAINNNILIFSGMTPGGIENERGELLTIELDKKISFSEIKITESNGSYYLNDGKGTAVNFSGTEQIITKEQAERLTEDIIDIYPPENFSPKIVSDPEIFSGQSFLVFDTKDKGSGIAYFRVAETKKIKRDKNNLISPARESQWKITTSPYILKDQKLSSYILVEAIDQVGNRRLAIIYPQTKAVNNTKYYFSAIIILFLLILGVVKQKIKCQKSKQK